MISTNLGASFNEPIELDLDGVYKDSDAKIPILWLQSKDCNPVLNILDFAKTKNMTEKYKTKHIHTDLIRNNYLLFYFFLDVR